jgi:hypothetical protein
MPAIIGTLPFTIAAGQLVSAAPVMGNYTFIQSQVNSNAMPLTGPANFTGAMTITGTLGVSQSVTIGPSTAGVALTVNQIASGASDGADILSNANVGTVNLLLSNTNTGASAAAQLSVLNNGVSAYYQAAGGAAPSVNFGALSNNLLNILTNSLIRMVIGAAGGVTIATPTSAVALTVNGVAGADLSDFLANYNGNAAVTVQQSNAGASASVQFSVTSNNGSIINQMVSTAAGGTGSSYYSGTNVWNIYTSGNTALNLGTNNNANRMQITAAGVVTVNLDLAGTYWEVGTRDIPPETMTVAYTFVLADRGKMKVPANASANMTIPANGTTAFPNGTTISILNGSGGARTIAITTDTLIWVPSGATGTRTIASAGLCTIYKQQSTVWYISGSGLS